VVVGAGPAGAATAILLGERGVRVVLLDRARFPRPKVCGEYLSPEGSRMLDRLGVLEAVEARGARPLRGMRIRAPDGTCLVADYPTGGPWRGYRDHALAVRRTALDAILVERAGELGVAVREGARAIDLLREGGRVVGVQVADARAGAPRTEPLRARLVVGADGRASMVAERLALRRPHPWLRRLALAADVEAAACDPERGEIFVDPPAYAIMNPVAGGLVNLSLVVPSEEGPRHRRDLAGYFDAVTRTLPGLGERLAGSRRAGPVRALGPLACRVAPPAADGVLLVGDAAGFLDPFTGEGMYAALRSAEIAAEVAIPALRSGDLSAATLAEAHRRRAAAFAGKWRATHLLQRVILHRGLAVATARRLARRPAELARIAGVFGDFVPPGALLRPGFLLGLVAPAGRRATPPRAG
jgi:geranylgeranyl reductase family protein